MPNAATAAAATAGKEEEEQRKREEKAKDADFEAYFRRHPVTLDALFDCPDVLEKIQRWFVSRGKNKYYPSTRLFFSFPSSFGLGSPAFASCCA